LAASGVIWLLLGGIVLEVPGIAQESTQLDAIHVYPSPIGSRIVLQSSRPIAIVTYTLENPDRLIVDPVESALTTTVSSTRTLQAAGIVTGWQVRGDPGTVDYLVFPVALPVQATVYQADRLITVEVTPDLRRVSPPARQDLAGPEPPHAAEVPEAPRAESSLGPDRALLPPARQELAGPEPAGGALSLPQAIEQAIAVHEPARIALEESELAMLKIKEARRNLFPGASLRGGFTEGTASGAAFREAQVGLQAEHPIYDAGRLRDTYRQALVNLQVTQKRYEKVRADFAFEVAQAYLELLAARQSVVFRQRLVEEAQRIFDATQRRFAAGLLTKMELLNVQSQYSQALFQLQGAHNDVAAAELKFRHRMNWDAPLPVQLPERFPQVTPQVELSEALRVATLNRPDVQINTLLVEFHRYEELLAKKKEAWKLDLTGFLGQSGGAFKTEPLNLDVDYSVALKASRPWGGHTGSVTATRVETSPRLGQTTRTDSSSVQGEFGFLNALAGATEIKQANVGRLKAQQDLADTKHLLEQEVHEAYYAYQKASLTLQHAQQKEQFRLEQVKVLRAQAELNEVLPSQLLEAELQLSDDQVSQTQAQSSYHIALARLNKAIGVTLHYS